MKKLRYEEFFTPKELCNWVEEKGMSDRIQNIVYKSDRHIFILFYWWYGD